MKHKGRDVSTEESRMQGGGGGGQTRRHADTDFLAVSSTQDEGNGRG